MVLRRLQRGALCLLAPPCDLTHEKSIRHSDCMVLGFSEAPRFAGQTWARPSAHGCTRPEMGALLGCAKAISLQFAAGCTPSLRGLWGLRRSLSSLLTEREPRWSGSRSSRSASASSAQFGWRFAKTAGGLRPENQPGFMSHTPCRGLGCVSKSRRRWTCRTERSVSSWTSVSMSLILI